MKRSKLILALLLIIALVISGLILYTRCLQVFLGTRKDILGPVGAGYRQIIEKRYKQGKVFRISFKEGVTNEQAEALEKEWQKIPGINGSYFQSAQTTGNTPLIDLFIEDISMRENLMQQIRQNELVQSVSGISFSL